MKRARHYRGTTLGAVLMSLLFIPALLIGCSDNKGSKGNQGPSFGAAITGTAAFGDKQASISANPASIGPGESGGLTLQLTTSSGTPIADESVQWGTTAGTLEKVAGKTDDAGKDVNRIFIPQNFTGVEAVVTAVVAGLSVQAKLPVAKPGTLRIDPAGPLTLAPGDRQALNCVGGVDPVRWEPSGGTLNRHNERAVVFTAGSQTGTFFVKCRDAADSSASVQITIGTDQTLLTINPSSVTLKPGQTQNFQASGGRPPYAWSFPAGAGVLSATSGSSIMLTAGVANGTFTLVLTDSVGATKSAAVKIEADVLSVIPTTVTLKPGQTQNFQASGGAPPYTWSFPSGAGTLSTTSGAATTLTAGTTSGTFTLVLTDSAGKTASAAVTIQVPKLELLPDEVERVFGGTGSPAPGSCSVPTLDITFTVTGGVPPYTFSATAGTVTPPTLSAAGTVTYTISVGSLTGGTNRTESVTVRDSLGGVDTSKVTIRCTAAP